MSCHFSCAQELLWCCSILIKLIFNIISIPSFCSPSLVRFSNSPRITDLQSSYRLHLHKESECELGKGECPRSSVREQTGGELLGLSFYLVRGDGHTQWGHTGSGPVSLWHTHILPRLTSFTIHWTHQIEQLKEQMKTQEGGYDDSESMFLSLNPIAKRKLQVELVTHKMTLDFL